MPDSLAPTDAAPIHYPLGTQPEPGAAAEVAPGVLWLQQPLPMALNHVNCYALDDGDSWTIIDTGFATSKSKAIWQSALDGPLAGKPVGRVVVTHHHPDHVGLAAWFMVQGATLAMPRTGWLMTRMMTFDEQPVPNAETLQFYRRAGMDPAVLKQRTTERPFNYADIVVPLPLGYTRLIDGGVIRMGGRDWDIRMGHGHAPEHATFWSREDNLVIGGDQLLPKISANLGVYATEPDADPVADWLNACAALAPYAREDQLVLPGHKLPYTGLPRRLSQMASGTQEGLDRLLDSLGTPKRAGDCFDALYQREIMAGEYGLALVEAVGNLNHLHQTGLARRWLGDDGAWWFQAL
ncbi:MBL fold metallo-hydrolase [Flavimaricola marinus]|uniref:Metallo-beta-lactamase superfamily protein n=1 Tax=Flavimaricola marinus TaxID=1819565 RepID=A0A238LAT4_9RHOB|nr:MBL fold metallo-hydrolase [Flavimaricola marinus]SMY06837.1 Metallo-beta-lactamase superfamily protein [Flavimaricola marinus]